MVGSQTTHSTPGPSFGHNLCCRCPNGSCKPILDIYVLIFFQWYKELFNPLSFDPCDHSLNIQKSTGTLTPKVGVPLGVWRSIPSHSLALPGACGMTPRLPFWPATLQPFALVTNPRLGCDNPTPFPSDVFTFKLKVESIKELWVASPWIYFIIYEFYQTKRGFVTNPYIIWPILIHRNKLFKVF
jgi:hypothetical protein